MNLVYTTGIGLMLLGLLGLNWGAWGAIRTSRRDRAQIAWLRRAVANRDEVIARQAEVIRRQHAHLDALGERAAHLRAQMRDQLGIG